MKTKIRRYIKRNLLSWLLVGFIGAIAVASIWLFLDMANQTRGYFAIGGEVLFVVAVSVGLLIFGHRKAE